MKYKYLEIPTKRLCRLTALTLVGLSLGLCPAVQAAAYTYTTLAGQAGGLGNADGAGTAARFNLPLGVAADSLGNLYVADAANNTLRKITSAGLVSTVAGLAGSPGSANGTGITARFNYPEGVALSATGDIFLADTLNHTIRKVTTAGVVTTFAGTAGLSGTNNGSGAAARFNGPTGLTFDGAGNLYVADTGNHTLRKITPAGLVSTLAGSPGTPGSVDGAGNLASFSYPQGLAWDSAGKLFVADSGNQLVREVSSAGVVSTLAGQTGVAGSADGSGTAASFNNPAAIATDNLGHLFVADQYNGTIRQITTNGVVSTLAGSAGIFGSADGSGGAASFYYPGGITWLGGGQLAVADTYNGTLRIVTTAGVVTTLAGLAGQPGSNDGTGSAAQFNQPQGLALDGSGNTYLADYNNHTIRKISPLGAVTTLAGIPGVAGSADGPGNAATFAYPRGLAVDGAGNVLVADTGNHTLRQISPAGEVTTLAGSPGVAGASDGPATEALFNEPTGLAVDGAGNLFVADTQNSVIRRVSPQGVVTTLAGSAGNLGSADGTGSAASFAYPTGLGLDPQGNLLVADAGNNVIRKVSAGGVVTTLAGAPGNQGSADGTGSAASFYAPQGLAVDSEGNVYVADTYNDTIRKITANGIVTTIGGSPGQAVHLDGTGLAARFNHPFGIAVDALGNLYISDAENVVSTSSAPAQIPVITGQPQGFTNNVGQVASLSVVASGSLPLAYQWEKSIANGPWLTLSNATQAALTFQPLVPTDAASYRCAVSNRFGAVTSDVAVVGVLLIPRTISANDTLWSAGDIFDWGINQVNGTAGADPGWDLLNINGTLVLNVPGPTPFTVRLHTLTRSGTAGSLNGFDPNQNYQWTIVQTSQGVLGFAGGMVAVDDTEFQNDLKGGVFSVTADSTRVFLNFTPALPPAVNPVVYNRHVNLGWRLLISDLLTNATSPHGVALAGLQAPTPPAGALSWNDTQVFFVPVSPDTDGAVVFNYTVRDVTTPIRAGDTPQTATSTVTINALPDVSYPVVASSGSGSASLSFAGIPGYPYVVQRKTNLLNQAEIWLTVWSTNAPTSGLFDYVDLNPPVPCAFYRLTAP